MVFSIACEKIWIAPRAWRLRNDCRDSLDRCVVHRFTNPGTRFITSHLKFLQSLVQQFASKPIDWEQLEESLIRADLGMPMTTRIIKTLQEREAWSVLGIGDVIKAVREEIARILPADSTPIRSANSKPTLILIVGVNGTGKTISTGKLAPHAPYERLIVVDAPTGGNALTQTREFHSALTLTGLIATKLNGRGKSWIVVAIQEELGLPTRFVGTGETIDDFAPFNRGTYIDNLL